MLRPARVAHFARPTFAGAQGQRAVLEINPYFVRYPTLSLSTPISVPSVMEVQVNGQVVSREPVAPGRLELRNLPMTMGATTRIETRSVWNALSPRITT